LWERRRLGDREIEGLGDEKNAHLSTKKSKKSLGVIKERYVSRRVSMNFLSAKHQEIRAFSFGCCCLFSIALKRKKREPVSCSSVTLSTSLSSVAAITSSLDTRN